MPIPAQIADYKTFDVPPYLIEFFRGTDLAAYAAAIDVQYDELEQALFDILNGSWLDLALGAQLDVLGVHLNLARTGMDDTTYKTFLALQAFINHGAGTPESAIATIRIVCQDPVPLYLPAYPAGFGIFTTSSLGMGISYDLVDNLGDTMVDNLGDTIEIGVFTPLTPAQIGQIAPAGVQMMQLCQLLDNLGDNMVDNAGNLIGVMVASTPIP